MKTAISEALKSRDLGEVPVGASILDSNGELIASAGNANITLHDPSAHAEILAIRKACQILNSNRLWNCVMYVTLEPCAMCAAAISFARIDTIYFGAYDYKFGAITNGPRLYYSNYVNYRPKVYGGINETECSSIITKFFQSLRENENY